MALTTNVVAAILALTFVLLLAAPRHSVLRRYARNLLIAVDQLVNALLFGDPDETISSRCARRSGQNCRLCIFVCRVLDFFDRGHCDRSIEDDEGADDLLFGPVRKIR